jgi:ubiquinone/menaquinone biosynthesis C-methylase UbiE
MPPAAAPTVPVPPPKNPLGSAEPWDMVAEAYAAELLPMFELFAGDALKLAGVTTGMKVVDVATGPGTLALMAAAKGAKVTALDFSAAMIQQLQVRAGRAGATIDVHSGDGQRLLFPSDHFDRAFSMFGLMFFPDRGAGFRELLRVLVPGGRAVVASWAPLDGAFGQVMESLRAHLPQPAAPVAAMPLSDAQVFAVELASAGFSEVSVTSVSHTVKAPSADAFWASMQRSTAPVVLMRRKLGEAAWAPIAAAVQADLERTLGKGVVEDRGTALLGTGVKGD